MTGHLLLKHGTGLGELVDDLPNNAGNEAADAGAGEGQDDDEGVRRHPNMSFTNRLRAMDKRLGTLSTEVDDLTYVVSGLSEQYDQFYDEFSKMRLEQQRFQKWNAGHLSQFLSFHHINHIRFDGTPYSYVPDILDLEVQQGVNFMSSTPVYSTTPYSSPNLFGLFDDANAGPSTSQNLGNDMDEE
nr:hypothetical protein [Tanacetum cinerariifolium]